MKKFSSIGVSFLVMTLLILLFASCKKNSDTTPPPPALPVINSFSPTAGNAGTIVTISGKNFSSTAANDIVSFNGTAATVTSATTEQLIVTVPNDATTGKITVKVASSNVTSGNDFTVIANQVNQLSEARYFMVAASSGNKILFAGGATAGNSTSKTVDIYDVTTGTWTTAQLSQPRMFMAAASAGNKIVFAGGQQVYQSGNTVSTVDIYDVSTNAWTTAQLSEARYFLSAASAGNKILFAGGLLSGDSTFSKTVDIYDVSTNVWTTAQLSEARCEMASASAGNKIFFAGGNLFNGFSKTVDIYDVSTNTWTTSELSGERLFGESSGGASAGNTALFAGGCCSYSTRVDIFNVSTNAWTTAELSEPKTYLAAAGTGNKIVIAGGARVDLNGTTTYSKSADIYDVSTNTWSASQLSEARCYVAGAAAGNKIVIAGGYNGTDLVKTVDIYDVQTGIWTH